jgi:N-acetylglucosamine-6-sulfatase
MQQKHWIMRQQSPIDKQSEQKIDQTHQKRVESLQSVDRHIDRFVRLLEQLKVLDNTIIMYTSDNGFQLGQHRLPGDKRHLYEHDIRVPFVMRGPKIPQNVSIYDKIGLNIDIAPTMYHIIHSTSDQQNIALPETMDGVSMLPLSNDGVLAQRKVFLISYFGESYLPCNLMVCPPNPPNDFHIIDGLNNTYHCLRSIVPNATDVNRNNWINFTYCRFDDDQNFGEYYDHTTDPWQLHNKFPELSAAEQTVLDDRLVALRYCRGDTCRSLMTSLPSLTVTQPRALVSAAAAYAKLAVSCTLASLPLAFLLSLIV